MGLWACWGDFFLSLLGGGSVVRGPGQRKELVGIEDEEKEKRAKWTVLRGLRGVGGDKSETLY